MTHSDRVRQRVLEIFSTGDFSAAAVAEKTGVSKNSVLRWAEQEGSKPRRRGGVRGAGPRELTEQESRLIRRMYVKRKMPVRSIAKAMKCSMSLIYSTLRRSRVRLRHRKTAREFFGPSLPEKLRAEAMTLLRRQHGWSAEKVGMAFSLSRSRVNQIAKEMAQEAETP